MSRSTSFLLTIFAKDGGSNPDQVNILKKYYDQEIQSLPGFWSGQIETGEKDHPHIQCYYETEKENGDYKKLSLKQMRTLFKFNDKIEGHIEPCKSPEHAKLYVKKDEGRIMALADINVSTRIGRYAQLINLFGSPVTGAVVTFGF